MIDALGSRILYRELQTVTWANKPHRSLYGHRRLVESLDIVNELDGHSGCVNALSWSKSGRLLASGSDDQHLNIHTYLTHESASSFQLTSTVATGHTQNIFSVKFMPHHNDTIVVTAAGDGEVRIFDLEYAGSTRAASAASSLAHEGRRRGRENVYNGVRYLSDGDTDCRVYRSHNDRVKRIVTESSPHLFLTCSEDGEVRQWDLRLPSSAYPSTRSARATGLSNPSAPPALISYKRYGLDLNTISCSASQPHYIALGGAHLHAFLHDRRMTGRDRLKEAGRPLGPIFSMSESDQELMRQATQCVRKFAPQGQRRMKRSENGHITACKISDARPNEMIVSWSRDYIYSFDLVRSPDLDGADGSPCAPNSQRKRKRPVDGSEKSLKRNSETQGASQQRDLQRTEQTALRIRYGNGQSEDVPLAGDAFRPRLSTRECQAAEIAQAVEEIRSTLFERGEVVDASTRYTKVLGLAASVLPRMEEVLRSWTYPLDPTTEMVASQRALRYNREEAYRFVQSSGTLARVMGGRLQTPSGDSHLLMHFIAITVKNNELTMDRADVFTHDFLKAVLLWLESGVGRLIEGFVRPGDVSPSSKSAQRFPIPESDAVIEALDDILFPYLTQLAGEKSLIDLDTNRFEVDENRILLSSELEVMQAFSSAVKLPFADLSSIHEAANEESTISQDREAARFRWGHKVARAVLYNATSRASIDSVRQAFGGRTVARSSGSAVERLPERLDGPGSMPGNITIVDANVPGQNPGNDMDTNVRRDVPTVAHEHERYIHTDEANDTDDDDAHDEIDEDADYDDVEGDDDMDSSDEDRTSDSEDENDAAGPGFVHQPALERRRLRERVEAETICAAPFRKFTGHCNVKTVKDVNYFGLNDEYVVSGSDDGNFFIWDSKTTELVNVLEGDGEVVNVIQGHPYETMLAVSGIDHTIKIFSPDGRAREAARLGRGVTSQDASSYPSLSWPHRIGRRAARSSRAAEERGATDEAARGDDQIDLPRDSSLFSDEDDELPTRDEYVAPRGLASRQRLHDAYRIMNQNDIDRQGGEEETYITREMLAQLAARIREQRARLVGRDNTGPMRIELGDDCIVQ